jgi:hypothetical protein
MCLQASAQIMLLWHKIAPDFGVQTNKVVRLTPRAQRICSDLKVAIEQHNQAAK